MPWTTIALLVALSAVVLADHDRGDRPAPASDRAGVGAADGRGLTMRLDVGRPSPSSAASGPSAASSPSCSSSSRRRASSSRSARACSTASSDDGPARRPRAGHRDPAQHRVRDGRPDRPGDDAVRRRRGDGGRPLGADPGVGPADRRRPRYVVDSPRFRVADPPNYTTFVTFGSQDGLDDRIDLHRRAAAGPRRRSRPSDGARPPSRSPCPRRPRPRRTSASATRCSVTVDPGDPIMRNLFPRPTGVADATVVGLYTVPRARTPLTGSTTRALDPGGRSAAPSTTRSRT